MYQETGPQGPWQPTGRLPETAPSQRNSAWPAILITFAIGLGIAFLSNLSGPTPDPPLSVPVELVGTWHGGAGDSYYYTFDSHGQYRLEHARSGWREEGTFIVDGQSITFSPRGGYERTSAWEIQPLMVTLLFIDGFSYVKA